MHEFDVMIFPLNRAHYAAIVSLLSEKLLSFKILKSLPFSWSEIFSFCNGLFDLTAAVCSGIYLKNTNGLFVFFAVLLVYLMV